MLILKVTVVSKQASVTPSRLPSKAHPPSWNSGSQALAGLWQKEYFTPTPILDSHFSV